MVARTAGVRCKANAGGRWDCPGLVTDGRSSPWPVRQWMALPGVGRWSVGRRSGEEEHAGGDL